MPKNETIIRLLCGLLLIFLLAAVANYQLQLGWFGDRGRLVVSVVILLGVIVLELGRRLAEKKAHTDEE